MMRCFILFSICLTSLVCKAQSTKAIITGKVHYKDRFYVNIYEPINGYYNIAFFDSTRPNSVLINGKDSIYKTLTLEKPAFITVYFTDKNQQFLTRSDLLLFPGDSVHITVDPSFDSVSSIQYSGSNAAGQRLFNEINFQPYHKYIPVLDVLDRLPANESVLVQEIDSVVALQVKPFAALRSNQLITEDFLHTMQTCFKSLLYGEVVKKFLSPGSKREVISKSKRDSIMEAFFTRQKPDDPDLKGLYLYPFYMNSYFDFLTYKKYNLNSAKAIKNGSKAFAKSGVSFLIEEDFTPFPYYPQPQFQEDLWALEIVNTLHFMPGKYDQSLISQFDSIFPNSKWRPVLLKQHQDKFLSKNIGYRLQSPVSYVDTSTAINNFADLLSKLPANDPVFIDIWATWCSPCIAAFGHNKKLDSFLIANKISKLYISLDDASNKEKWEKAIAKFSLGGYHVLANKALKEDIRQQIYKAGKNDGMAIPRYLLVDRHKVIVADDASSPTDGELLIQEIKNKIIQ